MKFSFVDLETTGSSVRRDRIIEIGILRVEDGNVVDSFQQLINPQMYLNPYIEKITGIHQAELESAPTFDEVIDTVLALLEDSIFVAHNVRFDYSFLKSELRRYDIGFQAKQLCTVKLSRSLFPQYRKHSLDSLIERFQIPCPHRHRAFDDAKVMYEFFQKIHQQFEDSIIKEKILQLIKTPALPAHIQKNLVDTIPEKPGVYIFYNQEHQPVYIGKSKHIRTRVLSHFQNDLRSARELSIKNETHFIDWIETGGELSALLKEAEMIKQHQPIYNRMLRRTKKLTVLLKSELPNKYFSVEQKTVSQITADMLGNTVGIFKSQAKARRFLEHVSKEYLLCNKLLGLEKTKDACFGSKIEQCNGACEGIEQALTYNLRFIEAFSKRKIKSWPFDGPIIIRENTTSGEAQPLVIDKWCIHTGEEEMFFDYDTYKILARYILNPKNYKSIKVLTTRQFSALSRERMYYN